MMKVGMIVHAYYLKDARVRQYAELLASKGHKVDVYCLREGSEPSFARQNGVDIHRVRFGRLRGGRLSYLVEYFVSFLLFTAKLARSSVVGKRFDVLHIHNMPDFLVFCGLFQRMFGTKLILDVHDLMSEVAESKYQLGRQHWLPTLMRVEERLSTRFAFHVITANHAFADILSTRGVPRSGLTVVMNSVKGAFFLTEAQRNSIRAGKPEADFHIIYIGTVAPRYGLEMAVAAIAQLHKSAQIPGLRFSIIPKFADEGSYLANVLARVERLGLAEIFKLMDPVPHDLMPSIIAAADAMIYAPTPDVHTDIAISLKIPEAIAVGCPVVAARLSVNLRYFGDDTLYMFEPGNIEECTARLREIHEDPVKARARAALARSKLENFDWNKQGQIYLSVLEQVCGSKVGSK